MSRSKLRKSILIAALLGLSIALSFVKLWKMPMGGSVTLVSMLPIILVSILYPGKVAFFTAFGYSLFQLFEAVLQANVFPYCETGTTLILCILFDYLFPFTILFAAGFFSRKKTGELSYIGAIVGTVIVIFFRFVCHYITGVVIWGQWADGMAPALYSLFYNGEYLLPECLLTVFVLVFLLRVPKMKEIIENEKEAKKSENKTPLDEQ